MKSIILLVLCASAALASNVREQTPSSFRAGSEFTYAWDNQVVTGIPGASKLYSGLRIQTTVVLQVEQSFDVHLTLTNIKLYTLSQEVGSHDPKVPLPLSLFTDDPESPEKALFIKWLSSPIVFKYKQGQVFKIRTDKEEPFWSLNVKRALLNSFQIQFKSYGSLERSKTKNIKPLSSRTYTLMEEDVAGMCESIYAIVPSTETTRYRDHTVTQVTKVRNYDNCREKLFFSLSTVGGQFCHDCKSNEKPLVESSSQTFFNITGTSNSFMIKDVSVFGRYTFTPYSDKGGRIATYVSGLLKLTNSVSIPSSASEKLPKLTSEYKPLILTIPALEELKGTWLPRPSTQGEITAKQNEIKFLLNEIANHYKETILPGETTVFIHRLTHALWESSLEQVRAVCKNVILLTPQNPKSKLMSKILMDVLPTVGTPATAVIIIELIENNNLPTPVLIPAVNMLAFHPRPTPAIIKRLMKLTENTKVPTKVKYSLLLTGGALINSMCNTTHLLNVPVHCTPELKVTFANMFVNFLKKSKTPEGEIILLKSIGNAGVYSNALLKYITKRAWTKSTETELRIQAIYSMRRMALYTPLMIRSIVLPVLVTRTEKPEVRIAAYTILIDTQPPGSVLQLITRLLNWEPSINVASFIYTHLTAMANTTYPCLNMMSKNAKFALHFMRPINPGFQYSRMMHMSYYNKLYRRGVSLDTFIVKGLDSLIPKAMSIRFGMDMLGFSMRTWETGYYIEGINKVLQSVLSPVSGSRDPVKEKVSEVLRSVLKIEVPRRQPTTEEMRKIDDKVPIKDRVSSPVKGHFFLKFFGNELMVWQFNEEVLLKFFSGLILKLKSPRNVTIDYKNVLKPAETVYTIPTVSGFPLSLNGTVVYGIKANGWYKAGMENNMLTATADIRPSFTKHMLGTFGVDAVFISSGVAVNYTLQYTMPMSGKAMVSLNTNNFTTIMNTPTEEKQIFINNIEPFIFIQRRPLQMDSPWQLPIRKFITGQDINGLYKETYTFGKNTMGLEFIGENTNTLNWGAKGAPFIPLNGKQHYAMFVKPGVNMPTTFEFGFTYGKTQVSKISVPSEIRAGHVASRFWSLKSLWSSDSVSSPSREIVLNIPGILYYFTATVTGKGTQLERKWTFTSNFTVPHKKEMVTFGLWTMVENVPTYAPPRWMMCMNGLYEKKMPDSRKLIRITPEVKISYFWRWGTDCNQKTPRVSFIDTYTKTPLQLSEEKLLSSSPLSQRCVKDRSEGRLLSRSCSRLRDFKGQLLQCNTEIDFEPGHQTFFVRRWGSKLVRFLQTIYYNKLSYEDTDVTNTANRVLIQTNLTSDRKMMSFDIKMPNSYMKVENVSYILPYLWKLTAPSVHQSMLNGILKSASDSKIPAGCVVEKGHVQTYNGATYRIPEPLPSSSCDSIVAQDCSPARSFKVILSEAARKPRALKILVAGRRIKVSPSSKSLPIIEIDSDIISSLPHTVKSSEENRSRVLIHIHQRGSMVVILAPEDHLKVLTDSKLRVIVSPSWLLYQGKLCGLCGTLSGEPSPLVEPKGPLGERVSSLHHLALKYIIPSKTCDINRIREIVTPPKECSKLRSDIVERIELGDKIVCMSRDPIRKCLPECRPKSLRATRVRYHCLPASFTSTKELQRESLIHPLYKISSKPVNWSRKLLVPSACVPRKS